MDKYDAEKYAAVYDLLADVLERKRQNKDGHGMSFALGDLARRVFVGTKYDPPDELLEEVVHAIRNGQEAERIGLAARLREHSEHLTTWNE